MNFLKRLFVKKCEFHKICKGYQKDHLVCNDEVEAGFCGRNKEYARQETD
jgi:hypothetical protein